jgi:N-acetylmuramoyl-L-alanine amidase
VSRNRDRTDFIIVHCSATLAKQDIGAKTIHGWHMQRGIYSDRGLTGYHFVIRRSGLVELGRDLQAIGAHALGYNARSVGICMVGGARKIKPGETPEWDDLISDNNFTTPQFDTLARLVTSLMDIWPSALVGGHRSFDTNKGCPAFDVFEWQQRVWNRNDKLRLLEALARDEHKVPETTAEEPPKES